MSYDSLPEIILPYELYPYLITEVGEHEYLITILPLLCNRVVEYFTDGAMQDLFVE